MEYLFAFAAVLLPLCWYIVSVDIEPNVSFADTPMRRDG